jgi:serine/threonine protein kinase
VRDVRHVDKLFYTLSDGLFYEPFPSGYQPLDHYQGLVQGLIDRLANDWLITRDGVWFHVHPKRYDLPLQGWKIHVSATPTNGAAILKDVATIALSENVSFKFAIDENMLATLGSKGWPRGGSGKFITIYPSTIETFKRLMERLYSALRSEVGPYILSDNRFKDCQVLYYRFGGFQQNLRLEVTGQKTLVLVTPDGETVPDNRSPYFSPPPWVTDPFASDEPQAQSSDEPITLNAGKYIVKQVFAFSNSGGVYLAQNRDSGNEVVIKEARANTAVQNSVDAIARLKKEQAILELLADTGVTPRPLDSFYDWEHFFLVEEHIDGVGIREIMLTESPLMLVRPSIEHSSSYYDTFTKIFRSFSQALTTVHDHGIVIGDISANNIKIDPSTRAVRLIDFEGASRLGVDAMTDLFTPGFKDTKNRRKASHDFASDYYGLAAIMLYAMFPIAALSSLKHDLYDGPLETVLTDIGWAKTPVGDVIRGLVNGTITSSHASALLDPAAPIVAPAYHHEDVDSEWCAKVSQELAAFLLNCVEPTNEDRLFPADPFMYHTNPLSLGFGASGILFALNECGFELPTSGYTWLERKLGKCKGDELPPGLLTGSAGIAWCLWKLGLQDRAREFMALANRSPLRNHHHSYLYGMAGIGMANLYFYLRTGDIYYLGAARELGDVLLERGREDEKGISWESDGTVGLGYGYGQSGVALFFLRLAQVTGNEKLLFAGRRALEFDLSHAVELETGVLSFPRVPSGQTVEPYLEQGSAGIAKVALRYGMFDQAKAVLPDTWRKYSGFPGLLYGLGSFVDIHSDAFIYLREDEFLELAKRPLSGLRDLYLTKHSVGSATPGDGLFRISCDYATGVAGVLRSLHRFIHHGESDFTLDELTTANWGTVTPAQVLGRL